MNRSTRRAEARRGKRRTKPPVPHMKTRLPGAHATQARGILIEQATSAGRYGSGDVRAALIQRRAAQ